MPKSESQSQSDKIEAVVVRLLTRKKKTLAVAESCTGGCIANRITNVPGASKIFPGGVVAYSNAVKQKFLGVRSATIARHGAVSEAVAREMAEGARKKFGADFAIAVTGIAGPGGGSRTKPVGTVFIALADAPGTVVERRLNPFRREQFKRVTAEQALKKLFLRLV
jgi:PncC family amidohydrolase